MDRLRAAAVVAVAAGLAGCGGGGSGGGGSQGDGEARRYETVGDLTGQTLVSYTQGGATWATRFDYLATGTSGGIPFVTGTGWHATSAFSEAVPIDSFTCQTWADLLTTLEDGVAPVPLGETYLCQWEYAGGGSNWYAFSIEPDGTVGGEFAFAAEGKNGVTLLLTGQSVELSGEHDPDFVAGKSGQPRRAGAAIERAYRDLAGSAD